MEQDFILKFNEQHIEDGDTLCESLEEARDVAIDYFSEVLDMLSAEVEDPNTGQVFSIRLFGVFDGGVRVEREDGSEYELFNFAVEV